MKVNTKLLSPVIPSIEICCNLETMTMPFTYIPQQSYLHLAFYSAITSSPDQPLRLLAIFQNPP